MPRRKHPRRIGQADKEKRSSKVIQAWRMMDPEISSRLSGTMHELERDGAIPHLTQIWNAHKVPIVDPRLVKKEMSAGFELGFNTRRAIDDIYRNVEEEVFGPTAKLGNIAIKGTPNKRLITVELDSPDIVSERSAAYSVLGEVGMRGFQNERRIRRKCSNVEIVLAKTIAPVKPDAKIYIDDLDPSTFEVSQESTIEAVSDALMIHGLYDETVEFGELRIGAERSG